MKFPVHSHGDDVCNNCATAQDTETSSLVHSSKIDLRFSGRAVHTAGMIYL